MRGTAKLLLLTAFAMLLAAGFGACGGDDSGEGETGSVATATQKGSASFHTPGGDNSVQEFGEEADTAELEAASAALATFLDARASGDWATVCDQMAATARKPIEGVGARAAQLQGKDCAELLGALAGGTPPSSRANTLSDGVDSLRVERDRGLALYHGTDGTDYFIQMLEEDGEWKVGALSPTELP